MKWMLLVVALLAFATTASAAEVVLLDRQVSPSNWTTFEITNLSAGNAILDGGAGETLWPHPGGRVAVQVLVPPDVGTTWTIKLNGESFTFPVETTVSTGEASPRLSAVLPRAYYGVSAWRPARPASERAWVMIVTTLAALAVIAMKFMPKWRAVLIVSISVSVITSLVAWRSQRSSLAIRTTSVQLADGERVDRWWFAKAPDRATAVPVVVAFEGETLPVAFSAEHLRQLSLRLHCDSQGVPQRIELTLMPGSVVAVVQRIESDETVETASWARPLLRGVYRRR